MTITVAIVGSGPSGFYTADALLKKDVDCEIDIIERLHLRQHERQWPVRLVVHEDIFQPLTIFAELHDFQGKAALGKFQPLVRILAKD